MPEYDGIIIGAGPNGLLASAYLLPSPPGNGGYGKDVVSSGRGKNA